MASEQDDSIITVVTCEGNISDPDFPYKLSSLVARLRRLLLSADKPFHITNVEPWNSVRVTFNIPREAAQRLRQLAHAGDRVLRELGILSVQIEGDQVISLTIAGRFNEPQEILLQTTDDDRSRPPSSSSLDAAALETPPASSSADPSRKNISQFLSQQGAAGTATLATPTSAGQESHFPGPLASQADFKSPNVVAPGSEPIPFPPKSTPTPPSRTPGFGPFPFASMTHAMNTMHSSHHTATTPPQGSSPSRFPFSPPPPYPGSSSSAFQPVRPSSFASSTSTAASATMTTASSTATSPTVNNLPRGQDRANAALTSPLLVNLLQSDLSQTPHSGGKVFPPPPSEPVAAPKRKRKPRKSKEKLPADGAVGSPGASSNSCLSTSPLGLPADSIPHAMFVQPFGIALPSIPLSPSLTPPSISPPSLIGQPLTPTDATVKPHPGHHFAPQNLHHRVPPLPSPPPTAPPSTSTSNNSGQSSQEAEHELSPWPSPSKRTQHLINPFTGQLEPMSSEDEGDSADVPCLDAASESSSLHSNPFSEVGRSNDDMPIGRRMSAEAMPSPPATESKVRETVAKETSPPSPAPSTSPASGSTPVSGSSEKIKLRLKLEPKPRVEKDKDRLGEKQKAEGILSMLQYKVDVSFVNIPSRRTSAEANSASAAVTAASVPASTIPVVSSSSVLGSLTGGCGPNVTSGNMPLEPRVPPLHISIRGRNVSLVKKAAREMRDVEEGNDLTASAKMPRSRSPRGFLTERGGRSAGVTRTQNPASRKVPPSRGGGNSRRARGMGNPSLPGAMSVGSGCSASAAAIISAVARNAISAMSQSHPALEGRAMAASPPAVAREKTLLSGGSFVLEPGRPSRSPPPTKQTAQVPCAMQGNSPAEVSPSTPVSCVQISKMEAESSTEGVTERKLSHHPEQQQGNAANSGKESSSRSRANTGERVDADDSVPKEPANAHRENNHGQLTMQQNFSEERSKPSNPAAGKVNLATSELNALLDRPVSPYNPSMTRRNSAEGAKVENLVRPTLAKGMSEALAAHSMRSKFQNVLPIHQRNVLDERLHQNLEIGLPTESVPRERLKGTLWADPPKVMPGRRPSKERCVPAFTEASHAIVESQPSRTSPASGIAVKQLMPEEHLPDSSASAVHESSKEAEPTRSSPRLRPEPVLRPLIVCNSAAGEVSATNDRTEMPTGQMGDSGTLEHDTLRTRDSGKVCGNVSAQFGKPPNLVKVSPTYNRSDSKTLLSGSQRESVAEVSTPIPHANTIPMIPGCALTVQTTALEEVTASQNTTSSEATEIGTEPVASVSCKAAAMVHPENTNADICGNDLLTVISNDHAAVENQIVENCHASSEEEVVTVKRLATVRSPETDVPLVDMDVSPQITGIRRNSKVSALGPQEKLRLAATISASSISQLVPSHGGSMLVDRILPVNQMDGLPEDEGDADAEFGPVESLPHHHLHNSVTRSTSMAIVTITASPSSASPSGSSPDSLNIGGTSSEENGDQMGGRNHGDHRSRHHPFPRNQCGSSGSPYEDSGIDSMDAIMEKLPDDSSPIDKREDTNGTSNDAPLPTSSLVSSAQPADSAMLPEKSTDEASCESKAPVASESTGIDNQNYEPNEKEPEPPSDTFQALPATMTLSTASVSTATTSGEQDTNVVALTEEAPNSDIVLTKQSVDGPINQDESPSNSMEEPHMVSRERATSQEMVLADSTEETAANQVNDEHEPEKIPSDQTSVTDVQGPSEFMQTLHETADAGNSDDPINLSRSCGNTEVQENVQKDTILESSLVETEQGVSNVSPTAKTEEAQALNSEPAAEAASVSHHSIISVSQEEYTEEATNLLASVVFEQQDGRSAEHVTIVTEGELGEPESPSGPTQLLVFTVEDMDSIMMSENAEHEMSLVQVTPANEDGNATLEFTTLEQREADRSEGDGSHLTENCIDSTEGIAVVQVQLAKDEDQAEPREETGEEQQASQTERRNTDAVIATAAVVVQVNNDANSSREQNHAPEPIAPKASTGQMILSNNISQHSSLQSTCTSPINAAFVQQGEMTLRSLSPTSTVPIKLVTLPSGLNSQVGRVSENGGVFSLARPIPTPAVLPASPVKVVMSRVCADTTASTVNLTAVLVKSPERPVVSGTLGITSTASVGVYPIMSSTTAPPAATIQTATLQVPTIVPINASFPTSMVAPPLVRPTSESDTTAATNAFDSGVSHGSAAALTAVNSTPVTTVPTGRSMTASRSPGSPPRSRAWIFPGIDCPSAVQNSTSDVSMASEHNPVSQLAAVRPSLPSPTPTNLVNIGLPAHFVPLPVVVSEGNDSDADTNCSSSSMSSGSGHHHHSDTGQEDYSKDEPDDMYMGNTSITSGDHNYIFRASRTTSRDKERRPRDKKEENAETEKPADVVVPSAENCSCNSSPERNSVGESNKLEQLSIEIPADNDTCEVERRATRSTRSNSRLASPNSGSCIASPSLISACEAETEVRTLPNRTAAKRRREDSDSDSERLRAFQNSLNAHGATASDKEDAVPIKSAEKDVGSPKSPAYGANAHVYSKPVKRKCSENAAELIKACIGVDDNPKRTVGGKQHPAVDGVKAPAAAAAAAAVKNVKSKEDGPKSKGRVNASTGEGSEESSDDEVTLSELVTKARSGKAKQVVNNTTEDRSITRNSKQRQNAKDEDAAGGGGGKIERVNSRSNSKREDGKGAKLVGAQRESRKEERASSRLGGRLPEKGRRASPQTRGQERSPQRTNHRSRTKELDRAASPSNPREENEAGKRKLRSSGSSGYYDSLPQKRRRFSRDNR